MICSTELALDARLEPSTMGEVALASSIWSTSIGGTLRSMIAVSPVMFIWLRFGHAEPHFIGRCSTGSFLTAQEMFDATGPIKARWSGCSRRPAKSGVATAWIAPPP